MKVYSMTIQIPKDHKVRARFYFGRWWNISTSESLDNLMKILAHRTTLDKKGRILCIGRPAYEMMSQERLFVVKMGHDNILWKDFTPLGQVVRIKLTPQM